MSAIQDVCGEQEKTVEKSVFFSLFGVWRMLQSPEIEIFVNAFTYHPEVRWTVSEKVSTSPDSDWRTKR